MAVYVVSDPVPASGIQPIKYVLTMDGGTTFEVDPQTVPGGVRLHYDVTNVSSGTHNMTVSSKNMWGQSTATPPPLLRRDRRSSALVRLQAGG